MDINTFNSRIEASIRTVLASFAKRVNNALMPYDLTKSQSDVLIELKNEGAAIIVTELAKRLDMPASNISNICTRLEYKGYIERVRADEDRRIVKVKITHDGDKAARNAEEAIERMTFQIAVNSTDTERDSVIYGLETYARLLKDGCED